MWAWGLIVSVEYIIVMMLTYHLSIITNAGGLDLPAKYGGGRDGLYYHQHITESFNSGVISNPTGTSFVPMMTEFSKVLGKVDIFSMKLFNMAGLLIMLIFVMKTMQSIGRNSNVSVEDSISKTMLRIALFPSALMVIAIAFSRDVWISALFVVATYLATKIIRNKWGVVFIPLLIITIEWLSWFRGYAGLSVVVGLCLYGFIRLFGMRRVIIIMPLGILAFYIWFSQFKEYEIPMVNMTLLDAIQYQGGYYKVGDVTYQRTGGSDFMSAFDAYNFGKFLFQLVQSYVGNFIGPFIWQIGKPNLMILFIFETLPTLYMLYRLLGKSRKVFLKFLSENQAAVLIMCQMFAWWTMMALSNKNTGAGMRLRVPLYLFMWMVYYVFREYEKKYMLNTSRE